MGHVALKCSVVLPVEKLCVMQVLREQQQPLVEQAQWATTLMDNAMNSAVKSRLKSQAVVQNGVPSKAAGNALCSSCRLTFDSRPEYFQLTLGARL